MALVNRSFMLDITPGAIPKVVNVSEYDQNRQFTISLVDEGGVFAIPSGTTAKVEGTIGSNAFSESATISGNTITFTLTESMTAKSGDVWCKIKLTKDSKPIQTAAFILRCDKAGVEADTVIGAPGFEEQINMAVTGWLGENASIKNQADGLSENVFTTYDSFQTFVEDTTVGKYKWHIGGISPDTGANNSARTEYARMYHRAYLRAGSMIDVDDGYKFTVARYSNNAYVPASGSNGFIDGKSARTTGAYICPADGYYRIAIAPENGESLGEGGAEYAYPAEGENGWELGELLSHLKIKWFRRESRFDSIDERVKAIESGGLKEYYTDDGYLDERINSILGTMSDIGVHGDNFVWITDPHYYDRETSSPRNGLQSTELIRCVMNRANIGKVFLGGDFENGNTMTPAQALTLMQQARLELADIWDNTFAINGNHEYNNPGATEAQEPNELSAAMLYQLWIKDKEPQIGAANEYGDYWMDNQVQKIRYFFIGCNRGATIRNETIAWFGQQIGQVPAGYTVVVLSHTAFSSADESGNRTLTGQFGKIASIMDAANSSASVTVNNVAYNYTSLDVDVACAITGHVHADYDTTTTLGIPIIATTCDRAANSVSTDLVKALRVIGTISEQAFDVVQIDTDARKIYMTRIGGSTIGAELVEGTNKVVDHDGDDTQYNATEWTIYSPYKDREFSY